MGNAEFIISPSPILDSSKKSRNRNESKRDFSSKPKIPLTAGFLLAGVFVAASFPALNTADASVFSFIADALSPAQATGSAGDSPYNSQNIALLQAPLSSKIALAGGEISIVDNTALQYQAETDPSAYQSDQISSYVVRDGDTLSQIAKMFNVSVNTIVWANDIVNGKIAPGQTLIILPVTGIQHVVKSGDTLQSIAKKYESDLEEIARFNNLDIDAKLTIGNEIIVPNVEGPTTKTTAPSAAAKKVATGYFQNPLAGEKYRKTQEIHGHNGKDLAAAIGTPVHAAAAGKVIVSKNDGGWNGGYGNYIVISHPNGMQTLYAHLQKTAVSAGSTVTQGQTIGYVGNTGKSTGSHLHVEVRGGVNPF